MGTLILVAHPEEQDSGTQAFLTQALRFASQEITRRVLPEGQFSPQKEMKDVLSANRIIFQFPLYWYSAPAILHQWLADCLITPYKEKLKGKELGLVVSTGRPESEFGLGKKQGYSLSELLRPFVAVADTLGMQMLPYFLIAQFEYMTDQQRQKLLIDYIQYLELSRDSSFSEREHWFVQRLADMTENATDTKSQQTLAALDQQITDRSDRLAELKDEIAMIKNIEEGDL